VPRRTAVRRAAAAVGAIFLLVGILGFIPGMTGGDVTLGAAAQHPGTLLLGLVDVSVLHNVVHMSLGVVGLALARASGSAKLYLVWGGAGYLLVCLYRNAIDHESSASFIRVDGVENWFHMVLAIGMVVLGLLLGITRTGEDPANAQAPRW